MTQFHPNTQIAKSQGNAFDIPPKSTAPDSHTAPRKRCPKPSPAKQSAASLMTPEERAAAVTDFKKCAQITISKTPQADRDRSAKISGKRNEARSQ